MPTTPNVKAYFPQQQHLGSESVVLFFTRKVKCQKKIDIALHSTEEKNVISVTFSMLDFTI